MLHFVGTYYYVPTFCNKTADYGYTGEGLVSGDTARFMCDQTCHCDAQASTIYYNINILNVKGSI